MGAKGFRIRWRHMIVDLVGYGIQGSIGLRESRAGAIRFVIFCTF